MVVFIAIASVPFIHKAIRLEEKKEKKFKKIRLLKEHGRIISMFIFLFLGFVLVFCLLYVILPRGMVENIFRTQIETIVTIHSTPTGNFFSYLGSIATILLNNVKLMFFCLVFSFFYGVGAIFILSWNASVMGVAIGEAIKEGLNYSLGSGFQIISASLLGYFVHGIPEIVAYFMVGLGGGIFSMALMKEKLKSKAFKKISLDCVRLIGIALVLMILAAIIEIFVSPHILI